MNNSTTVQMKPKTGLDLFGEEPVGVAASIAAPEDENADVEVEAEDDYDNWIVDDLGGGMQDEPTAGIKGGDGYIKEMGMSAF